MASIDIELASFKVFDPLWIEGLLQLKSANLAQRFMAICAVLGKESVGLRANYKLIAEATPENFSRLCRDPAFQSWVEVAQDIALSGENLDSLSNAHLADLKRFALGVSILSGCEPSKLDAPEFDRTYLPCTDYFSSSTSMESLSCVGGRSTRIVIFKGGVKRLLVKRLRVGGIFELNNEDPMILSTGGSTYEVQTLNSKAHADWETVMRLCIQWLSEFAPALLTELRAILNTIVPVVSVPDVHLSCSFPQMIGAVYLSYTDHPLVLLEALVHEFAHNRLYLIQQIDPCVTQCSRLFYSPWRIDPRPINGLFHAVYVFSLVARVWSTCLNEHRTAFDKRQQDFLNYRHLKCSRQLDIAFETLEESGSLTDFGRAMLTALQNDNKILGADAQFLGASAELKFRVEEEIIRHKRSFNEHS